MSYCQQLQVENSLQMNQCHRFWNNWLIEKKRKQKQFQFAEFLKQHAVFWGSDGATEGAVINHVLHAKAS